MYISTLVSDITYILETPHIYTHVYIHIHTGNPTHLLQETPHIYTHVYIHIGIGYHIYILETPHIYLKFEVLQNNILPEHKIFFSNTLTLPANEHAFSDMIFCARKNREQPRTTMNNHEQPRTITNNYDQSRTTTCK